MLGSRWKDGRGPCGIRSLNRGWWIFAPLLARLIPFLEPTQDAFGLRFAPSSALSHSVAHTVELWPPSLGAKGVEPPAPCSQCGGGVSSTSHYMAACGLLFPNACSDA